MPYATLDYAIIGRHAITMTLLTLLAAIRDVIAIIATAELITPLLPPHCYDIGRLLLLRHADAITPLY